MFTIAANISAVVRVNPQKGWQPETASTPIAQPPTHFQAALNLIQSTPSAAPKDTL